MFSSWYWGQGRQVHCQEATFPASKPALLKTTGRKPTVQYFWSVREICLKPTERTQEVVGKQETRGKTVAEEMR